MDESGQADAPAINKDIARRIPVRSISLAIVVMVVLYFGMATLVGSEAFFNSFSVLSNVVWVQVFSLSLLSYLLRFARWHYFIGAMGHKVPIYRNLEIYLAAFALTLTPGKSGETIRSIYLHHYGVSYPHSLGAFVSERLLDLVAVVAIASLVISMFPDQRAWLIATIASIVIVIMLLRYRLIKLISKRIKRNPVFGHTKNLIDAFSFLSSGRRFALAVPLSLAAWASQGFSLYLIVQALGYDLAVGTVIAIYCLSILAGAASFIPGGLGATEAAIVFLMSEAGVNHNDAIVASIASRGLTLWLAISLGVISITKIIIRKSSHD